MYIAIALVLFAVFSYYATWIDEKFNIDLLGLTFVIGAVMCIAWKYICNDLLPLGIFYRILVRNNLRNV